jgi:hypothetical protein
MPSKHFIDGRSSFADGPCRPWPSRRRYCSGASKGGHYIGTYGAPPMSPLRCPAKAKAPRSLITASIRLVQRYARARRRTRATLQFKSHFKGEAKYLRRQTCECESAGGFPHAVMPFRALFCLYALLCLLPFTYEKTGPTFLNESAALRG